MKAAQRWITFAEILRGDAVADLDRTAQHLDEAAQDLAASNEAQRKSLAGGRIARARDRLAKQRAHNAQVRELLWPPDEDEVTLGRA